MKNTLIIPTMHLRALNAFDVGNNPEHIDLGLCASQLNSLVESQLHTLSQTELLTITGHALELLHEESPEHLDEIKQLVQQNDISLVGVPYYNTALALLSPQHFTQQWEKNQEALQSHFGKEATSLYVGAQAVPKHLSSTMDNLGLTIIGENSLHIENIPLGRKPKRDVVDAVGNHSAYHISQTMSELAKNVSDELIVFEPFLAKDKQLYQTWQHLANVQVLTHLNGENPQLTYDTYFSMMNILNDLAHTVRNVELTKRGEFETQAEIVEQPSTRMLEVLSNTNTSTIENKVIHNA